MEKPRWRRISSTPAIESRYLRMRKDVIELPNGTILEEYFVRESLGFTMVFALTPEREVVLIEEYRYAIDAVLLEFPAGTIDAGEEPLACAKRELREETGYSAPRWEPLFAVPSEPARSSAIMYGYLAFDARKTDATEHDPSEAIEVSLHPLARVATMVRQRRNSSLATTAIAYAALERLRELGTIV
jgi:ADP-ribose pyrophosphatase